MTRFAREARLEEGVDQLPGQRLADDPGAQTQQIRVVVLPRLVGGEVIVAEGGPHAAQLVGGDAGAGTAAADHDSGLDPAILDRLPDAACVVGVIDRSAAARSHVEERYPPIPEVPDEQNLQRISG